MSDLARRPAEAVPPHARRPAHNLPAPLTSFVGRSAELAELRGLLAAHRLVTVTGPGGAGKTRLARQLAAGAVDAVPDGVWWVDLGAVTDPGRILRVVAAAVRAIVEPSGDVAAMLAAQLRDRRLVLCLDTCEHLLDACAGLVHAVLQARPGVTVLATSRERLGLPGERVWRAPPLEPDDAARLFTDRAELVRPGPAVPDDRHRTLAASIGWSHDLLDAADQALLHELSVFAGGFTAEAAAAVCGDDRFAGITRLVDKSLVVVETRTATRFRLLDSIREYAARELAARGTAAALRDRHLDHFVAFAEAAAPRLERDQDRWRAALLAEHDNLRAALQWGFGTPDPGSPRPGRARRLAVALARFWFLSRHDEEGRAYLHRALAAARDDRTRLQAALLSGAGLVAIAGGLSAEAAELAGRALELADALGDDGTRGRSRVVLGAGPFFLTDQPESGRHAREAERWGLAARDPFAVDAGCLLRARALTNTDRHAEAVSAVRGRAAGARARGERMVGAFLLGVEVRAALHTGDLRRAARLARKAVATTEPLGDLYALGHTTFDLAWPPARRSGRVGVVGRRGPHRRRGRHLDHGAHLPCWAHAPDEGDDSTRLVLTSHGDRTTPPSSGVVAAQRSLSSTRLRCSLVVVLRG